MAWVATTLGELCDRTNGTIRTGPFGSQLHESDYSEAGTPVIMPKNIVDGRVSVEGIARVSDEHVHRLSQHKLHSGDIIYGRRGDIGRRALVTDRESGWLCGTGCLRISLGDSVVDPAFLYYYLGQPSVTAWIQGQAIGATLPNLNTAILRSVEVRFPELPEQQRIAGILSAYDGLIENNTRRIAILEEMARSLYREWFVDFRFPEHEQATIMESELGLIPEGWHVADLGAIADVNSESLTPGHGIQNINYVDISSVSPGRIEKIIPMPFENAPSRARRIVRSGDTIWSTVRPNRKSYSIILDPPDALIVSTGFAVIRPRAVPSSYLYNVVTTDGFADYLTNHATGSAYPAVSAADFERALILIPPTDLLVRFQATTGDMLDLRQRLLMKNLVLGRTRDLLLPSLVSGEIELTACRAPNN